MLKARTWFIITEVVLGLCTIALVAILFAQTRTTINKIDDRCTKTADEFEIIAVTEWRNVLVTIEPAVLLCLCLLIIFNFVFALKSKAVSLNMCLESSFGRIMQCLMLLFPHLLLALVTGALHFSSLSFLRNQVTAPDLDCQEIDIKMLPRIAWVAIALSTGFVLMYFAYVMCCNPQKEDDDNNDTLQTDSTEWAQAYKPFMPKARCAQPKARSPQGHNC
jgi:hypothetical protein